MQATVRSAVALGCFSLCLIFLAGTARGDETAPSPCGLRINVTGDITHYKTPADVLAGIDEDLTLYQEEVYGDSFSAVVEGLPEGTYTVEIDFVEAYHQNPNARLMRITSGDAVLADRFSICKEAGGKGKPYHLVKKIKHEADAIGGPLTITFSSVADKAKFNAIHIKDSDGILVSCVKAVDLQNSDMVAAMTIPEVSTPAIYMDPSKPMGARIDDLISRMSLAEKSKQLMNAAPAIPRLNVPAYDYWNECLHGVARNGYATVFPQAIGLAAAWDPDMMQQIGDAISTEARAKYYQAFRDGEGGKRYAGLSFWTPNINIFRDPRWGRGQETYGEDPFLTGRLAVRFIEGIQEEKDGYLKAMACAKHFAVHNGPEESRHRFNATPSARDLYETYLPQFEAAVREAKVGSLMSAYNAINGVPCSADHWLLTDLLRDTWGFKGHVVSDCGAVNDIYGGHKYATNAPAAAADAINAGLDLECGGVFQNLPRAIAQELTTEKAVNAALHQVLEVRFRLGLFDPPSMDPFADTPMSEVESPAHLALARKAACESIVLLKNDGILPLDRSKLKKIAVLGQNANRALLGNYEGRPSHALSILDAIRQTVGDQVRVDYAVGSWLAERPHDKPISAEDFRKAVALAKEADVIIYIGGLDAGLEGEESSYKAPGFYRGDRTAIELPEMQENLIKALHATGKPVVFVNCSGSAIAVPWENENLRAIVQAWYGGGEGGPAVASVLFGDVNPSGKLPVTFYEKTKDLPDFEDYSMANRTYRYFTGKPLYPFGHGLSYTQFKYSDAKASASTLKPDGSVVVSVRVENTGNRAGDEVVQFYVRHLKSSVPQPLHSLAGFKRVSLEKGASTVVEYTLPASALRWWDENAKSYVVPEGPFEIRIGSSSADIRAVLRMSVL